MLQVHAAVKLMNLNLLSVNGLPVKCLGLFPINAQLLLLLFKQVFVEMYRMNVLYFRQ